MPLTDDQACSVVRKVLSRYMRLILLCHDTPIDEFFNEAFIAAKTANNEAHAWTLCRFALLSLANGDTHPGSRSSRFQHKRTRKAPAALSEPLDATILRLDLEQAFSILTSEELILLRLRVFDQMSEREAASRLGLCQSTVSYRQQIILQKLAEVLKGYKSEGVLK